MARKRRKKSQAKLHASSSRNEVRNIQPANKLTIQQLLSGKVPGLEESIIEVLNESEKLADEPEFIDLYTDREKTIQVTEHWMNKYSKRLTAAEKKGQEEFQEALTDMRFNVISELTTPEFRQDVNERLLALQERLKVVQNVDKLKLAMLLSPVLNSKGFPWETCGLIEAVYMRTLQEELDKESKFDEVIEALESEAGGPVDLEELIESPEKLDDLSSKVISRPGLRERLEQQIDDMMDAFENELGQGKVALNFFTMEEIMLPVQRMETEYGKPITELSPTDSISEHTFEIIRQCLTEIMTLERMRQFRKDVQEIAKDWIKKRNRWGAALQAELYGLENDQYEESKFILSAFLGQMAHGGKSQESQPKPKKRRFFRR